MAASIASDKIRNVPRDAVDLRDQLYLPTLRPLLPSLSPAAIVLTALQQDEPLYWLPRDQGSEGTCSAQATASLIDLQRMLNSAEGSTTSPVSARMLYEMGRRQNDSTDGEDVSLRHVIKAFYHNGVCRDEVWRYAPGEPNGSLNVQRSKDARQVSLGAYYRLRASLNDYHAALNEAGPIIVSSATHDGWDTDRVEGNGGRILPSDSSRGGHAFVVVGYDATGFLVLNSWGACWGGFLGCRGLGHWLYEDWADSVFDGWVMRLGVSTPVAFAVTIGEQGLFFKKNSPVSRSIPEHQVKGHLIHLDDGVEAENARYPYSAGGFAETCRYLRRTENDTQPVAPQWNPEGPLEEKGYRGIMLRFGGSILGLDEVAEQVAREKKLIKKHGLYPLTIAWCNDFVDKTTAVLVQTFADATKQTQTRGDRLDRLIEDSVHGVGRAFWRDIELASRKSAGPKGPIPGIARQLLTLPNYSLHVVCDGAGVLPFCELLRTLGQMLRSKYERFLTMICSIDLVTPVIEAEELEHALRDYFALGQGLQPGNRNVCLHVPTTKTDHCLTVGMYSRSILDLVEKGFSERRGKRPPNYIGKSLERFRCGQGLNGNDLLSQFEIEQISIAPDRGELLQQEDLYDGSELIGRVLRRIAPVSSN
ncbi:C1 family peptidase [Rhizobium ruizarguesonis]|uniref:C1 family peptidase n=1 Tax=Rhizobium ruizarguesonis TaxID=2081791 RepID=UPI00102FE579|nr:C1 family peptidase [Rhizobium ruizarguesonis]TBD12786.1 hypothetical protein ELH20_33050 [Rhizobium ruizarguesonis]